MLFDKFTQADSSTTRQFGGTGLGLAICRQLAELMRGEVGATSQPGHGSTFHLELPLQVVEDHPPEAQPAGLAGARVLVVDDLDVSRQAIASQLSQWRMHVEATASANEALCTLRAEARSGRPFDVALLDQQLSEGSGEELARAIRSDVELARTPIVVLDSTRLRACSELQEELNLAAWRRQAGLVRPPRTGAAGRLGRGGIAALPSRAGGSSRAGIRLAVLRGSPPAARGGQRRQREDRDEAAAEARL